MDCTAVYKIGQLGEKIPRKSDQLHTKKYKGGLRFFEIYAKKTSGRAFSEKMGKTGFRLEKNHASIIREFELYAKLP